MSIPSTNDLYEWSARDIERRAVLDLDLNYPPPDECIDQTGHHEEEVRYFNPFQRLVVDNHEVVDEDIVIISPGKFAEARKKFRRNYSQSSCGAVIRFNGNTGVYGGLRDVTSWPPLTINNNVSLQEHIVHNLDLRLSSESSSRIKATDVDIPSTLGQSSDPPAAPSLRCSICIEQLVEETSTKCGHIFCKSCIETAIAAQHRCPICRRKLRKRDIIRIYLPFSS